MRGLAGRTEEWGRLSYLGDGYLDCVVVRACQVPGELP